MKQVYLVLIFLIAGIASYAQNYTRDAGLRFGEGVFFTHRQFFDDDEAVEVMAGLSKNGFRAIGMKEYFQPLAVTRTENLKLIYGYGIHAGINYTNKFRILNRVYYHDWMWTPQFGFDGIVGVEYSAADFPFLVRVAAQPYFEYSLNKYFNLRVFNIIVSFNYRF
jgi:hypothetical protein